MNNNKLFVAGLSYDLTNEQLQEHFSQFGTVTSANIITDKMTGKSRGFGFVEMSTPEEAKKAIETLDNTEFAGRTINVKEARPQEDRPRNSGFRGGDRDRNRDFGGERRGKQW